MESLLNVSNLTIMFVFSEVSDFVSYVTVAVFTTNAVSLLGSPLTHYVILAYFSSANEFSVRFKQITQS